MGIKAGSRVRLKTMNEWIKEGKGFWVSPNGALNIDEYSGLPKDKIKYLGLEGEVVFINCSNRLHILMKDGAKVNDIPRDFVVLV